MTSSRIVAHLRAFGERTAVIADGGRTVTYARLAELVDDYAHRLGSERRLVALAARNEIGSLVAYLGALAAGCVVLLTGEVGEDLSRTYDPDVRIGPDPHGGIPAPTVIRQRSAHTLHPDLALLLSTSGSTGSPKLVRLSYRNLFANAAAIATYLRIGAADRAATTLPLFYCYGLSVVHSHLLRGASLLLTDRSVTDPEFWQLFRRHRATSFAAVPYTIDLLDRIGFDRMSLPHLRYVTQSGGRLDPAAVRRYAGLAAAAGWEFVVMYGQTEATSRMAYLPPALAADHPDCVGIAIPGGRFDLAEVEEGTELVYHGPNVMLGYAESAADLALGRTVTALRTGDLADRTDAGLYRLLGRRSWFAKIFGLRIDLQRIESGLAAAGYRGYCAEFDDRTLVVAVENPTGDPTGPVAELSGLPASAILVHAVSEIPRLPNGKTDYSAIRDIGNRPPKSVPPPAGSSADALRALFAEALGRDTAAIDPRRTFAELGGDSLTYVRLSARLGQALGRLPADWPNTPIAELAAVPRRHTGFGRSLDTTVLLRAIGIVLIVGSHAGLFELWGGAHVMLGVAGFNFARFALTTARAQRLGHTLRTVALIAVPTAAWVGVTMLFSDYYSWQNLLLLNKILGPTDSPTAGHLWFVEVLVYFLLAAALLLRVRWVDALARRAPFWFPAALLGVALIARVQTFGWYPKADAPFSPLAFWIFVLGWAAAKATDPVRRTALSAIVILAVPGYFDNADREHLVVAGLLLLIWLPALRTPTLVAAGAAVLADASLFTYLLHWQVYPLFGQHPAVAVAASLAVGVLAAGLVALVRTLRGSIAALDGPDLGFRLVRQLRYQQVARNGLTGKMIE
ncbi:AMP-binding protein [Nocardia terpenica]|uniref:AMP-binding protein n=1 Tax=Nocardia terpenica TaxID=455432 RepID=A0A6G9Z2W8_9NOCA|nr:AMP-binding protein [Nocardia terpenica]